MERNRDFDDIGSFVVKASFCLTIAIVNGSNNLVVFKNVCNIVNFSWFHLYINVVIGRSQIKCVV